MFPHLAAFHLDLIFFLDWTMIKVINWLVSIYLVITKMYMRVENVVRNYGRIS